MNEEEKMLLKLQMSYCTNYLEFGSGESTITAIKYSNIKSITSVESDFNFWHYLVNKNKQLERAIIEKRVTPMLIDIGQIKEWSYPVDESKKQFWYQYSCYPYMYKNNKYDLVLVDGRFRVACILQSCLNLSEGTKILVHDFYNRPQYHIVLPFLDRVAHIETLGLFSIKRYESNTINEIQLLFEKYKYIPE